MGPADIEAQAKSLWDQAHSQARFRPVYPNDHVVRFLMQNYSPETRASTNAVDLGCGGGRHTKLLAELGFPAMGTDISEAGLVAAAVWLEACGLNATFKEASSFQLPFASDAFDLAISYSVLQYADDAGFKKSVAELHRVLRKGGRAFVVLRTTDDYRFGKGTLLAKNTFRIEVHDTNEFGMVQRFLDEQEVSEVFAAFSQIRFERSDFSVNDRQILNSDWLISVTK